MTKTLRIWSLLLCLGLFSCKNTIQHQFHIKKYSDAENIKDLLGQKWLLIPFIPNEGFLGESLDYGRFQKKIKRNRPGQNIALFGKNYDKLSNAQIKAHKAYAEHLRQHHEIADSLIYLFLEDKETAIIVTPYVHSLQLLQDEKGGFQRRVITIVKIWDVQHKELLIDLKCTSTHFSSNKNNLAPPQEIFLAGLEAIAKKLVFHPLSGFTPSSRPDF